MSCASFTEGSRAVGGVLHTYKTSDPIGPVRPVLRLDSCACEVCVLHRRDCAVPGCEDCSRLTARVGDQHFSFMVAHERGAQFTPAPLPRPDALDPEQDASEALAVARRERDELAAQLEELRIKIGQVAVKYADKAGWESYATDAHELVDEIGAVWPEPRRVRVDFDLTLTVEVDMLGDVDMSDTAFSDLLDDMEMPTLVNPANYDSDPKLSDPRAVNASCITVARIYPS